jgi:hypothetical protein
MKWTIKLVFEAVPGSPVEHELGIIERAEEISPATAGLTIAEGKILLANLQERSKRLVFPSGMRPDLSLTMWSWFSQKVEQRNVACVATDLYRRSGGLWSRRLSLTPVWRW